MSNDNIRLTIQVAPFAGAWIEIVCSNVVFIMPQVAPFAGAWIEIGFNTVFAPFGSTSLPSRERGLKYNRLCRARGLCRSLPSRERGLKYRFRKRYGVRLQSLPSRERGLK